MKQWRDNGGRKCGGGGGLKTERHKGKGVKGSPLGQKNSSVQSHIKDESDEEVSDASFKQGFQFKYARESHHAERIVINCQQ